MSDIPFQPWGSRIVVKPDTKPSEAKTKSGLVTLSDYGDSGDAPMTVGTVVAVGKDLWESMDANLDGMIGTRVVYSPWAGFKLTVGQTRYIILDVSEVLGNLVREEEIDVR